MSRHEIREQVFLILFSMDFHEGEERLKSAENYLDETCEYELSEKERSEIISRASDIAEKFPEIDAAVDSIAEGWTTSRMGRAELTILRLSLYELKYDESVPVKVAINEAVELAKEYCSDDTPSFVNGILAGIIKNGTWTARSVQ